MPQTELGPPYIFVASIHRLFMQWAVGMNWTGTKIRLAECVLPWPERVPHPCWLLWDPSWREFKPPVIHNWLRPWFLLQTEILYQWSTLERPFAIKLLDATTLKVKKCRSENVIRLTTNATEWCRNCRLRSIRVLSMVLKRVAQL
jgi:hypothetical protein